MRAVTLPSNFVDNVLDAVDAKDTHRFVSYLTDDCAFRFGSAPAAVGRAAIGAAVSGFFESIAGCEHTVGNAWHADGSMVCEGVVCYRRLDGAEITLPFVNVFEFRGELISNYKIYIDIGPLYAA